MLDFLKRNKNPITLEQTTPAPKISLLNRLSQGLKRTRDSFKAGITNLFSQKTEISQTLFNTLETELLKADVGSKTTKAILSHLKNAVQSQHLQNSLDLKNELKSQLIKILSTVENPLPTIAQQPFVILMVGVNGAGKTTTIGKLAKYYQALGHKVLLAAGDTFRAAAVEQLIAWGEQNNISVIAQKDKGDSASVIFDAIQAAKARQIDIVIADTAGRLHTQENLMSELQKIVRVIQKIDANAPHEIMLVLDAGIGQNALNQAIKFNEAVPVSGITLTKLDGTARGGMIFAIANELKIPIRFVGLGEGIDDLKLFQAKVFVDALFSEESTETIDA